MNRRLVITGPESTGKSMLTVHLAGLLHLPYAQEYARIYLEGHGPAYDYNLLLNLSRWHKEYQLACVKESDAWGILDTDLINYKVWCDVAYGRCHPEIVSAMKAETGHLYLLCYPDIPWEPDPLREHKNDRMMLFERHRAEIEACHRPYAVISGQGPNRYENAANAARKFMEMYS